MPDDFFTKLPKFGKRNFGITKVSLYHQFLTNLMYFGSTFITSHQLEVCSGMLYKKTLLKALFWFVNFLPPYALKTFLCLRLCLARSQDLMGLIPLSLTPVMGHLGTEGRFFKYWKTSLPPGVRTVRRRFDLVLYDNLRR